MELKIRIEYKKKVVVVVIIIIKDFDELKWF